MNLTRRETLTLGAILGLSAAAGLPTLALAKDGDTVDQLKLMASMAIPDKVLGDPNAKVTVIEYLSPTCPHCARVANDVIGPFNHKAVSMLCDRRSPVTPLPATAASRRQSPSPP